MAPPNASAIKLLADINDKLVDAYSLIHPYHYYSEVYLNHVAKVSDLRTLAQEPGNLAPPGSADVENALKLATVNHLINHCTVMRNSVTRENVEDAITKVQSALSAFNEDFLLISPAELRDLVSKEYKVIRLVMAAHRSDLPQKDLELKRLLDRRHRIYSLLTDVHKSLNILSDLV